MPIIAAFYWDSREHAVIYEFFDQKKLTEIKPEKILRVSSLDDLNKLFADIKRFKKNDSVFVEWKVVRKQSPYKPLKQSIDVRNEVEKFLKEEKISHGRPLNTSLSGTELKIFKKGLTKLGIKIRRRRHLQRLYILALHVTKSTIKEKLKKLYVAWGKQKKDFNNWYRELID